MDLLNIEIVCGFVEHRNRVRIYQEDIDDPDVGRHDIENQDIDKCDIHKCDIFNGEIQKLPKKAFNADSLEAARGETSQGLGLPNT